MGIDGLLEKLASPAKRALEALKLKSIEALAKYRKDELAALHGIGPSALRTIEAEMAKSGIKFKATTSLRATSRTASRAPAAPAGYATIDEYLRGFSGEARERLEKMRAVIREHAPDALERIAYQMPTFSQNGNLVHFAAYKDHIGFYPTPSGIESFERELAPYKSGKGSIRFPLDRPMPWELIARIVRYRIKENADKAKRKKR
jgi:uncharacterized protein YdhG (YjbR/CyaY superfamily)